MLDNLYDNIGGKIKGWAKGIFILETVGVIILGLVLLFDEVTVLTGLLTMIIGPIVAWVSSWLLYAFGELVEKTAANEENTRYILKALQTKSASTSPKTVPSIEPKFSTKPVTHTWRCDNCGNMISQVPCDHCGYQPPKGSTDPVTFTTTDKNTIICSKCHFEQPSGRNVCWNCGATFAPVAPDAPFRCGKCDHPGPYEGNCPACGSSIKLYNHT